jgi:HAD superfamily hydrolase (TIGR01450 family)
MNLSHIRHFALDMDGTVYKNETWLDGALDFLQALEKSGRDYVFLTNNSSKSKQVYLDKLKRMGLALAPNKLLTSGDAAVDYLQKNYPGHRVYLLGNEILKNEFAQAGIPLARYHPDIIMTAFDTSLNYQKLQRFCDFARSGLPYFATHPDVNCPTETGLMPDIGAIHAFVQASTGRLPDLVIGKPHRVMCDYLFANTGWNRKATAAVGDRITTDVALAVNHGFTGLLVLSGATAKDEIANAGIKPDGVFDSVKEIIKYL